MQARGRSSSPPSCGPSYGTFSSSCPSCGPPLNSCAVGRPCSRPSCGPSLLTHCGPSLLTSELWTVPFSTLRAIPAHVRALGHAFFRGVGRPCSSPSCGPSPSALWGPSLLTSELWAVPFFALWAVPAHVRALGRPILVGTYNFCQGSARGVCC
jgi:hypothetical protein